MQVVPGVFLINGYPYGRHQNSYFIRKPEGGTVVDSGDLEDDSFATVEQACARWGLRLSDVTHLLITHAHFDHSSHAARLRRMGAQVVASEDTADALASGDDRCIGYAVGRKFEPCRTDIVVSDGQVLEVGGSSVRCIAAPGHARGLMVYEMMLNGECVWFCGDLVEVGPECRSLQLGWAGGPDYDRPTYLETLRKLAHMDCDTLMPGHGPAALGIGKGLIQQAYTKAMVEWR